MQEFNTFKFGQEKEEKYIDTFREKFDSKLEKTVQRFSPFDFVSEKTYVELKSRRCCYKKYPDTMVGKNKFDYADKLEGKDIFFCFGFTDGLYYWKYDKEQLGLISFKNYGTKEYAYIPINMLTDINKYANEF
jgi:hypothetical protein